MGTKTIGTKIVVVIQEILEICDEVAEAIAAFIKASAKTAAYLPLAIAVFIAETQGGASATAPPIYVN